MSLPCFICKVLDNQILIDGQEYHHAINVKRLKVNDKIEANDLNGNFFVATIQKIENQYLIAKIDYKVEKTLPHINIKLYQCLPNKLSKIDDLIEPISQLNVTTLVPVISDFCTLNLKDIQKKIPKWEKIAIQSIKQCKRLFPINIETPQKLSSINSKEELKIVFYEKELKTTLKDLSIGNIDNIAVVIGPEGGFSERDIDYLTSKGFKSLMLSDNVLKMETAVIAALAQINLFFLKS